MKKLKHPDDMKPEERDTFLFLLVGLSVVAIVAVYCIAKGLKLMPF
jgi:hypothetical protein